MSVETAVHTDDDEKESFYDMPQLLCESPEGVEFTDAGRVVNAIVFRDTLLSDRDLQKSWAEHSATAVYHKRIWAEQLLLMEYMGFPQGEEKRSEIIQSARQEFENHGIPYWRMEYRLDLENEDLS